MSSRRIRFHGLLPVLLALMAQLSIGASVPRLNPLAQILGTEILCHTSDEAGGNSTPSPGHPIDCLVCPLCVAVHAPPATLLASASASVPLTMVVVLRPELPPPSTAPPSSHRPPSQPRAPPTFSGAYSPARLREPILVCLRSSS